MCAYYYSYIGGEVSRRFGGELGGAKTLRLDLALFSRFFLDENFVFIVCTQIIRLKQTFITGLHTFIACWVTNFKYRFEDPLSGLHMLSFVGKVHIVEQNRRSRSHDYILATP